MDNRERLKPYLEEYLQQQGIQTHKHFTCLNPVHEDHSPSMAYDKNRYKVHCFSCAVDYDLFDVIGIMEHIDGYKEQQERAIELYGARAGVESPTKPELASNDKTHHQKNKTQQSANKSEIGACLQAAAARIQETDYLRRRGISTDTAIRLGVGYDSALSTGKVKIKAIIFPTDTGYTARNTDVNEKRYRYTNAGGQAAGLFNSAALKQTELPVFIVEGSIDALSIEEVGGTAVGMNSTSNMKRFIEAYTALNERPSLVLCLDNDDAGQKVQRELSEELDKLEADYSTPDILGEYNDPNERLQAEPEKFKEVIKAASMSRAEREKIDFDRYDAGTHVLNFLDGLTDAAAYPVQQTGFSLLDEQLGGGLRSGLYAVGAITSAGKTAFVLQICDQIAKNDGHLLIFSLEMAANELVARSISRESYLETLDTTTQSPNIGLLYGREDEKPSSKAFSALGVLAPERWKGYNDEQTTAIAWAVQRYKNYASGHIHIVEGMGDVGIKQIREKLQAYQRTQGCTPIIVIDYLQLLTPVDVRASDKQAIDYNIMELKRMSRDYKTPIIAISSFNRSSYAKGASMDAFKESGAIEYSTDVLLGLQFAGQDKRPEKEAQKEGEGYAEKRKKQPIREMEIKILKNRNGQTGYRIPFAYYPMFNTFAEAPERMETANEE